MDGIQQKQIFPVRIRAWTYVDLYQVLAFVPQQLNMILQWVFFTEIVIEFAFTKCILILLLTINWKISTSARGSHSEIATAKLNPSTHTLHLIECLSICYGRLWRKYAIIPMCGTYANLGASKYYHVFYHSRVQWAEEIFLVHFSKIIVFWFRFHWRARVKLAIDHQIVMTYR